MANDVLLNTTTDLNGKTLVTAEGDRSITGLLTYSRGASAPFAVGSGAANVANLDADKLDGQHAPTGTIVGTTDTQVLTNKTLTSPTLTTPTEDTPTVTNQVNLTGGQIAFPATQVPSGGANVLDDYKEGTWTPTITSSGGGTPTYTAQIGKYIKIGKLVFITSTVALASKGTLAAGTVTIAGLPYASENTPNQSTAIPFANFTTTTAIVFLCGVLVANNNTITLEHMPAASAGMTLTTVADLSATSSLTFTAVYCAAA